MLWLASASVLSANSNTFSVRPPRIDPDALKDRDQVVYHFVTVAAKRGIQWIDARWVRHIGDIDQHHIILSRRWNESGQRLDQLSVRLHHEEAMWIGLVS